MIDCFEYVVKRLFNFLFASFYLIIASRFPLATLTGILHRNISNRFVQRFLLFLWIFTFSIIFFCSTSWVSIRFHAGHAPTFFASHKRRQSHYTHQRMISITQWFLTIFIISQVFIPSHPRKIAFEICFWVFKHFFMWCVISFFSCVECIHDLMFIQKISQLVVMQ